MSKHRNTAKVAELNRCRPLTAGKPSSRFYWMNELARAGSKGVKAKTAHTRAAEAWAKDTGENSERYAEIIPSTPSNVEFFLKTLRRQNKKAGVRIKTSFTDGVVRIVA